MCEFSVLCARMATVLQSYYRESRIREGEMTGGKSKAALAHGAAQGQR